jgi:hypothetical protein
MSLSRIVRDSNSTASKEENFSVEELFSILTNSLARAGYEILDGDMSRFVIRDKEKDEDFEITISKIAG